MSVIQVPAAYFFSSSLVIGVSHTHFSNSYVFPTQTGLSSDKIISKQAEQPDYSLQER